MIKAIVFDAGGVMLDGNAEKFFKRCEKELGLKSAIEVDTTDPVGFCRGMQLGEKDPKDDLNDAFGGKLAEEKLKNVLTLFEEEWPQNPKMVELTKKLRQNYAVALLSNVEDIHVKRFKKEGFLELFDEVVLSNEVHLVKPDERIFKIMLEKLRLKAGECVFIDDKQKSVDTAARLGFKSFQFESVEQCERELKNLGVEF